MDQDLVTWRVSAQVEGGRRLEGDVRASSKAVKSYLMRRFLSRFKWEPGRLEYWLGKAKQGGTARVVKSDLDKDLPDPGDQLDLGL